MMLTKTPGKMEFGKSQWLRPLALIGGLAASAPALAQVSQEPFFQAVQGPPALATGEVSVGSYLAQPDNDQVVLQTIRKCREAGGILNGPLLKLNGIDMSFDSKYVVYRCAAPPNQVLDSDKMALTDVIKRRILHPAVPITTWDLFFGRPVKDGAKSTQVVDNVIQP